MRHTTHTRIHPHQNAIRPGLTTTHTCRLRSAYVLLTFQTCVCLVGGKAGGKPSGWVGGWAVCVCVCVDPPTFRLRSAHAPPLANVKTLWGQLRAFFSDLHGFDLLCLELHGFDIHVFGCNDFGIHSFSCLASLILTPKALTSLVVTSMVLPSRR